MRITGTLLVFVIFTVSLKAQILKGKITSSDQIDLVTASVVIKDSANARGIKEFTVARNGAYEIRLTKAYKNLYVEVTANNYAKVGHTILNPQKGTTYTHDFTLNHETTILLKDVKIFAKKKAYTEVKDTVNFNVESYKDGSDRKIQDIIRKLPGMEVNDNTGEIKYKGKAVETVQLDGDDLFSGNYTIGTKNINVDMIDKVQALENFSSNKLLKGLEGDGKVALNLKLKKKIRDISGSLNSSLGTFKEMKTAIDTDINFLTLSSKIKSFGTISFNNVAVNYSPFDYFGNFRTQNENANTAFKNSKTISEFSYINMLDNKRTILNNSIFANYNISLKTGPNTTYKSNFYFVKDLINSLSLNETNNLINNQKFTTSDQINADKKPILFRMDFDVKHSISNTSTIDYYFIINNEKINTSSSLFQNEKDFFNTELQTENLFLKSKVQFTKRISDKKAIQITSNQTFDNLYQNFKTQSQTSDVSAIQGIQKRKAFFDLQASYLGKIKRAKYNSILGTELISNPLYSDLKTEENPNINDINFIKTKVFFNNKLDYDWGNILIISNFNSALLHQAIKNKASNTEIKSSAILIEPDISLSYKFSRVSSFNVNLGSRLNPLIDNYNYSNNILVSNRTTIKNNLDLQLQRTASYAVGYNLYDLSKQFLMNASINYSENKGNFFSNLNIDQNNSQISYLFLDEKFSTIDLSFKIEKYLPFIQSTVRFRTQYNVYDYKNLINNSELRNNISKSSRNELFLKSAFDGQLNFQNILQFNLTKNKTNANASFENQDLNNAFKLFYTPNKKWFSSLTYDFYKINNKANYSFLDLLVKYIPKNKQFSYSFNAKNILNNERFIEIRSSDYYTSIYTTNIVPRSLIITCNYSF
ncbi:hypothetical protein DNC80_11200 [Flavobacterium sp. SOK18b]|uniref:carboxypeptidase regulatory-like domain-containing protein n=1 Tax=Flavobacterium sp. SOK18b TaxID=797900 RepID=UPI0015F8E739|nr:carboxypeptidase regulatory-like domain-containing protein [Flavobacterium sp. SOK18b]MBB1194228.1 hypothetical protein [Flavobacterium sp. SOK18b]